MRTLSRLFAAGVALRNGLYDQRLLRTHRLTRPVISIGNISVGGSGKTPFVIALGELLKRKGIAFDVLSRGYGRKSHTIAVVNPDGRPEQFGDEPLLIARKLQVPVVVAPDRYKAGRYAEDHFQCQLHLLDDGFQHRKLHRDFDIVMLPASDLQDTLLPLGRLREPLPALRRADAVVITRDFGDQNAVRRWMRAPENLWTTRRLLEIDAPLGPVLAFCGIARPQQFFDELKSRQVEVVSCVTFRDHHVYTEGDIKKLLDLKAASSASSFITTEKDEINLGRFSGKLQPLHVTPLRTQLHSEGVIQTILKTLEERCGCRL